MKRLLLPALIAALATPAHALIDTDTDGLGDIWENIHGFHIGPNPPANQAPTADPDGDGFTNLKESLAGTDPLDREDFPKLAFAQTPAVYEPLPPGAEPPPSPPPPAAPFDPNYIPPPPAPATPRILLDPPVSILTWPTVPGKTYEAFPSEDLAGWAIATGAFLGSGTPLTFESENLYEDGTAPDKLFWRVGIADTDSDGDGLTDYEELHTTDPNTPSKTLDPFNPDTDGDGIPDNLDPEPFTNSLQAVWDADSVDPSGAPLFASFHFTPSTTGGYPFTAQHITDISGNNRHGLARNAFHGTPAPQNAPQDNAEGIANHGFLCGGTHHHAFGVKSPAISFAPLRSLSFWLKVDAAAIAGAPQPVFSYIPKDANRSQPTALINYHAIRAFIARNPTNTGYEIIWKNWSNPANEIRERWTLDLPEREIDGRWLNLTFTWQGTGSGQQKLWACYANGVKQNRLLGSTYLLNSTTGAIQDTFLIGADASGGLPSNNQATIDSTFAGVFDRVRLHTATLTPAQIIAIFQQDTDNDGLRDDIEVAATTWKDLNGNSRRDIGEIRFPNGSPLIWQAPGTDSDGDGLTDIHEQNISRTDPYNHDSDGDLLPDGWEAANNVDPNSAEGDNGTEGNPDNDGLDNFDEWRFLTDPHLADTDGDGVNDGPETAQGSDPNNTADNGQAPPAGEKLTLKILVGDPSGSHSERWRVEAEDIATGQTVLRHASRQYGQMSTAAESTFDSFKPGKAYRFKLRHAGTDPTKLASDPDGTTYPDYDWSLQISYKDAQGNFIDLASPAQSKYIVLDPYNADTKSISESSPNLLAPESPWGTIGAGKDAKYDYEEKILPTQIVMMPLDFTTDFDRDGSITEDDKNKVTQQSPFIMWINDNDSMNEEPHIGDTPGSGVDMADQIVNGVRDLVDFFPVQAHLRQILEILPPNKYEFFITHPAGAFNFIEMPDIQPESQPQSMGAGSYLANAQIAEDALRRPLKNTQGAGSKLGHPFLTAAANERGILLIEAKAATTTPPSLVIKKRKDGQTIATIPWALPIETADVEKFYWRVNIRPAALGQPAGAVVSPANAKFRDSRKDRWFVFCHGYNVNAEAARGWNAETFKRLHQKGSNARFLGVSWEGNQGQLGEELPFDIVFTPDYWRNAYNAFASSHALKTAVKNLPGNAKSKTVIAGHSMGNLIASSAICDHGLEAEHYFLLNAAVAREAYQPAHVQTDRNSLRHPDWANYPTRLWSSDWFHLFPNGDGRKKLTWQGRFGNIATLTTPHNYYSSTEDVLDNGQGTVPTIEGLLVRNTGAWVKQEMSKGGATKAFVTGAGSGNWTSHGGWAFNPNHYLNYRPDPLNPPAGNLPDTAAITNAQLRANPFFKPFTRLKDVNQANGGAVVDATNGIDLSGANGSTHATEYSIRAWLLSHDVPALSNPAGKNAVFSTQQAPNQDTNIDGLKSSNWGAWKHSDLKNAPMDVVGKLYDRMVERGNLK